MSNIAKLKIDSLKLVSHIYLEFWWHVKSKNLRNFWSTSISNWHKNSMLPSSPPTHKVHFVYIITDVIAIHPNDVLSGICELSSNPPCCCYSYIQLITKSFRLSLWNFLISTQCHSCNFGIIFPSHFQTLFILTHFYPKVPKWVLHFTYLKSSKVFSYLLWCLNFHSATKCPFPLAFSPRGSFHN